MIISCQCACHGDESSDKISCFHCTILNFPMVIDDEILENMLQTLII